MLRLGSDSRQWEQGWEINTVKLQSLSWWKTGVKNADLKAIFGMPIINGLDASRLKTKNKSYLVMFNFNIICNLFYIEWFVICFPVLLHLFEIIPFYGNIVKYMHRDMQTHTVHSIIKQLQYKEEDKSYYLFPFIIY